LKLVFEGLEMKSGLKTILAALVLISGASLASAATITPVAVSSTFTNLPLTTITVGSASDISGEILGGVGTVFFGGFPLTLSTVSFSSASLGSYSLIDSDTGTAGFQFSLAGVAAGTYSLSISGSTAGGLGLVGGEYAITPVPEPESAALLLAGLASFGLLVVRRRNLDQ
jgi:hypothetical protein